MVAIIFTWIGAVLGIAVLLAMAFGAFVLDFDDALADRRLKTPEAKTAETTTAS